MIDMDDIRTVCELAKAKDLPLGRMVVHNIRRPFRVDGRLVPTSPENLVGPEARGGLLDRPRPGAAPGRQHPRHPRLQPRGARARALEPRLGPHGDEHGGAPERRPRDRHRRRARPTSSSTATGCRTRRASCAVGGGPLHERPQHRAPADREPGREAEAAVRPGARPGPRQGREGLARRQFLDRRPPVLPPGDREHHGGPRLGAPRGRAERSSATPSPPETCAGGRRPDGRHGQAARPSRNARPRSSGSRPAWARRRPGSPRTCATPATTRPSASSTTG